MPPKNRRRKTASFLHRIWAPKSRNKNTQKTKKKPQGQATRDLRRRGTARWLARAHSKKAHRSAMSVQERARARAKDRRQAKGTHPIQRTAGHVMTIFKRKKNTLSIQATVQTAVRRKLHSHRASRCAILVAILDPIRAWMMSSKKHRSSQPAMRCSCSQRY